MSSQCGLPEFISISQACSLLDCHPNLINTWENLGMIKPIETADSHEKLYSDFPSVKNITFGFCELFLISDRFLIA